MRADIIIKHYHKTLSNSKKNENRMMQFVFIFMIVQSLLLLNKGVSATLCEVKSCERVRNIQYFGLDIDSKALNVDIGDCNATYSSEENCTVPKEDSEKSCVPTCEPESLEIQEHSDRSGPRQFEVIKTCKITTPPECPRESCKRISSMLHFFPNSKYQTRVDVGDCIGGCSDDGNGCVATRTVPKSVEGPNGAITVDTVQNCACAYKGCHKVDHFKSVFNYDFNETDTPIREEKLINIGKCVGECEGVMLKGRCIPSDHFCFIYIAPKQAKCVPTKVTNETYVNANGEVQTVKAISECTCSSA